MTADLELADPGAAAAAVVEALRLQRTLVGAALDATECLLTLVPLDGESLDWSGAAQRQYARALYELRGMLHSVTARLTAATGDLDDAIASGTAGG
jgi:hypothetical protein